MKGFKSYTIAALRACSKAGMTKSEAAAEVGLSYPTVLRYERHIDGIEFVPAKRGRKRGTRSALSERGQLYAKCAAEGLTISQTARLHGVTRSAVHQWADNNPEHPFVARRSRQPEMVA